MPVLIASETDRRDAARAFDALAVAAVSLAAAPDAVAELPESFVKT